MAGKDLNMSEVSFLDKQIETLMGCKPLPETEVKALCEKVSSTRESNYCRQKRSW